MRMLEKIVSGGGRILGIIKLIIEYDIPTVFNTILRAKTEIITKRLDNNLTIIFEDRVSSSELSDVPENFKNIVVNNSDDIKKL